MLKRLVLTVTAAVAMLSLASASASAAVEVGNDCTANQAEPGLTLLQLSKPAGSALPVVSPISGVATKWTVRVIPFGGSIPTTLRVFRPAAGANRFTAVAESAGTVVAGKNTFAARVPVQAGDRFGAYGVGIGTLFCITEDPGDHLGVYEGNAGLGSTHTFEDNPGAQVAVSATVEPDADNDGYGDETQDLCPQSAVVQTACPIIRLGSYGIAQRNAALVLATSSYPAPVAVSATVNVPQRLLRNKRGKRKGKGKRGARSSALLRIDGGAQAIAPGGLVIYRLKFPARLRKALRNLPRKRKLMLIATTSATDVAGRPSSTTVKVKLPGQKKPNRGKRKAKGKRG